MVSDLTVFRDHARKMATADHKPDCRKPETDVRGWRGRHPDPACAGCNSVEDRALFGRLADEVDAYLEAKAGPVEDLFGVAAVEQASLPASRPAQVGDVAHPAELEDGMLVFSHPPGVICRFCLTAAPVGPGVPC